MEINVSRVAKNEGIEEKFTLTEELSNKEIDFGGEKLVVISPVKVFGSMINFEGKIKVNMNIVVDAERICARCLDNFIEHISLETSITFVKEGFAVGNDEDFLFFKNDIIKIDDIVLGEIASALPMKPLCNKGCKGLCPICGKNKNFTECNCKEDNIDPRMKILNKLFQSE